jgi:hypothetical protein
MTTENTACFIGIERKNGYIDGIPCLSYGVPQVTGKLLEKYYGPIGTDALLRLGGPLLRLAETVVDTTFRWYQPDRDMFQTGYDSIQDFTLNRDTSFTYAYILRNDGQWETFEGVADGPFWGVRKPREEECTTPAPEDPDMYLVAFLYDLMRDKLPVGVVEQLVRDQENLTLPVVYTHGELEKLARSMARRLRP